METSTMIRQLRATAKKHKNDKLHTFDTNITAMCIDVANRLEFLEKEKQEIRVNTIDEFAERLRELCGYEEGDIQYPYLLHESRIDETAGQMKAGAV